MILVLIYLILKETRLVLAANKVTSVTPRIRKIDISVHCPIFLNIRKEIGQGDKIKQANLKKVIVDATIEYYAKFMQYQLDLKCQWIKNPDAEYGFFLRKIFQKVAVKVLVLG